MFCHRFRRTPPGDDTALTRIGASSIARARVKASIVPQTLAAITHPLCGRRAGASRRENDRAALSNLWTPVFDRGKGRPITQFKRASCLLEIRNSKLVQVQTVTCSENQVI